MRRRLLRARSVDLAGVVAPPLLRIGQEIVGAGDLLELVLGLLVAGIEIGVQFLGQLPVRLADLVGGSGLGDAKGFIRVVHARDPSRARPASLSRDAGQFSRRDRRRRRFCVAAALRNNRAIVFEGRVAAIDLCRNGSRIKAKTNRSTEEAAPRRRVEADLASTRGDSGGKRCQGRSSTSSSS